MSVKNLFTITNENFQLNTEQNNAPNILISYTKSQLNSLEYSIGTNTDYARQSQINNLNLNTYNNVFLNTTQASQNHNLLDKEKLDDDIINSLEKNCKFKDASYLSNTNIISNSISKTNHHDFNYNISNKNKNNIYDLQQSHIFIPDEDHNMTYNMNDEFASSFININKQFTKNNSIIDSQISGDISRKSSYLSDNNKNNDSILKVSNIFFDNDKLRQIAGNEKSPIYTNRSIMNTPHTISNNITVMCNYYEASIQVTPNKINFSKNQNSQISISRKTPLKYNRSQLKSNDKHTERSKSENHLSYISNSSIVNSENKKEGNHDKTVNIGTLIFEVSPNDKKIIEDKFMNGNNKYINFKDKDEDKEKDKETIFSIIETDENPFKSDFMKDKFKIKEKEGINKKTFFNIKDMKRDKDDTIIYERKNLNETFEKMKRDEENEGNNLPRPYVDFEKSMNIENNKFFDNLKKNINNTKIDEIVKTSNKQENDFQSSKVNENITQIYSNSKKTINSITPCWALCNKKFSFADFPCQTTQNNLNIDNSQLGNNKIHGHNLTLGGFGSKNSQSIIEDIGNSNNNNVSSKYQPKHNSSLYSMKDINKEESCSRKSSKQKDLNNKIKSNPILINVINPLPNRRKNEYSGSFVNNRNDKCIIKLSPSGSASSASASLKKQIKIKKETSLERNIKTKKSNSPFSHLSYFNNYKKQYELSIKKNNSSNSCKNRSMNANINSNISNFVNLNILLKTNNGDSKKKNKVKEFNKKDILKEVVEKFKIKEKEKPFKEVKRQNSNQSIKNSNKLISNDVNNIQNVGKTSILNTKMINQVENYAEKIKEICEKRNDSKKKKVDDFSKYKKSNQNMNLKVNSGLKENIENNNKASNVKIDKNENIIGRIMQNDKKDKEFGFIFENKMTILGSNLSLNKNQKEIKGKRIINIK